MATRIYVPALIDRLREAGDRTVLRHQNDDVSGAALLAAIYRSAHALDELGSVRATWSPSTPRTGRRRWPSATPRTCSVPDRSSFQPAGRRQARPDAR